MRARQELEFAKNLRFYPIIKLKLLFIPNFDYMYTIFKIINTQKTFIYIMENRQISSIKNKYK